MMKPIIGAVLAASLLGGCQSIFLHQAKLKVRPAGPEYTKASSAVALEEGRQYLIRRDVVSAIASLQIAALERESAAAAHNGLAIAYAMLGRGDLAERYFRKAMSEDPEEPKYAANLSRYYETRDAALARAQVAAPQVMAAQREAPTIEDAPADRVVHTDAGTIRIATPHSAAQVSRVSAGEVAIRTLPSAAPESTADPRRRNPRLTATVARPFYPLRIQLGR